jgi:hypothetical protein
MRLFETSAILRNVCICSLPLFWWHRPSIRRKRDRSFETLAPPTKLYRVTSYKIRNIDQTVVITSNITDMNMRWASIFVTACLVYSSTMEMEAERSSETSVNIYPIWRRHIPGQVLRISAPAPYPSFRTMWASVSLFKNDPGRIDRRMEKSA